MSNEHENKPLKRALVVLDALEAFYRDRNTESFLVPFSDFPKFSPLLEDVKSLEIACNRINKKEEPDLQVNVKSTAVTENELTARSGMYGEPVTRQVKEIEIYIGDISLLKKRRQEINAQLVMKESISAFYFYIKGKQAFVGLEGSDIEDIPFKLNSDRFMLIHALYNKGKMTRNDLEKQLKLEEGQFHRIVGGVRKRVSKVFDVGLDALLIFDGSDAYELTKLREIQDKS